MGTELRYIVPVELSAPSCNAVGGWSCQASLAAKGLRFYRLLLFRRDDELFLV